MAKNNTDLTKILYSNAVLRDKWLNYLKSSKSKNTVSTYYINANDFLAFVGSKKIEDVKVIDIMDYMSSLTDKGNTNSTKSKKQATLKSFYNFLHLTEVVPKNMTEHLESIPVKTRESSFLTSKECIKLLEVIHNDIDDFYRERNLSIVVTFIKTGLRSSELCDLTLQDADKMINEKELTIIGKGSVERDIFISRDVILILKQYLISRKCYKNENNSNFLFITSAGNRLENNYINSFLKKYVDLAGIQKDVPITAHSLRHTFASSLANQNIPLGLVQKLCGHSSLDTTGKYLHNTKEEKRDAINSSKFIDASKFI